jgi:hypothetical protein
VSDDDMAELLRVDVDERKVQLPQVRARLAQFNRLPVQLQALEERLGSPGPDSLASHRGNGSALASTARLPGPRQPGSG